MIIDEPLVLNALLVSTSALVGAATVTLLRFQRLMRPPAVSPAAGTAAGEEPVADKLIEERLRTLEKILDDLCRKDAAPPPKSLRELPYENAVRMVQSGAGVDDITKSCGLKKGEAELLLRLHSTRRH